jgi:8-oxo-dGTP diphosphatase
MTPELIAEIRKDLVDRDDFARTDEASIFFCHTRALLAEVERQADELAELTALFDLQHTRMEAATALWQQDDPAREGVLPDLGALLDWLMAELDIAQLHIERGNDETMKAWGEVRWRDLEIKKLAAELERVTRDLAEARAELKRLTDLEAASQRGCKLGDGRWKMLTTSGHLWGWGALWPHKKAPAGTPARISPKDCDRIVDAALGKVREMMEMWFEDGHYHHCQECGRRGPLRHEGSSYICAECNSAPIESLAVLSVDGGEEPPQPHRCPACNERTTYQSYSGGREFYCPGCGNHGLYEPGEAPRRVQMLAEGRIEELRVEMREEIARRRPQPEAPAEDAPAHPEIVHAAAAKALIVNENDQILLLRESSSTPDGTQAGRWQLPGGRINPGETLEQGLVREVVEETGLTVQVGEQVHTGSWSPTIRGVPHEITGTFFRCESAAAREVTLSDEHDLAVWFDLSALDGVDVVEPDRTAITKLPRPEATR